MKPTGRNHFASTSILLVMTALAASATQVDLSPGAKFDTAGYSGLAPWTTTSSGTRHNVQLYSETGGFYITSSVGESTKGYMDGGITLWGKPVAIVLGTGSVSGGRFELWDPTDYLASGSSLAPLFRVDTSTDTATFNAVNVLISNGSLTSTGNISTSGNIDLTGGAGTGIKFGGAPLFTLDSSGNVSYASTRNVAIVSTTSANATATAGALTVAGGIGVLKDSYINGLTLGRGAGSATTYNTAFGLDVLKVNTTGTNNTGIGYNVMKANNTGGNNSAFGTNSLATNTIGNYNTAIGVGTLYSNTEGVANTALGGSALSLNTIGSFNTGLGTSALNVNTTGAYNTAVGQDAMKNNIGGYTNAAVGFGAMYSNTYGGNNAAFGVSAGKNNQTGTNNVYVGQDAGSFHANGTTPLLYSFNCIYIGSYARAKNNEDNNSIVIGNAAIGEGPNTVVMGNANTQTSHFFGQTTLTNTPWKNRPGGTSALADPLAGDTDRDGNALVVEGHTVMKGKVTIAEAQGDISMGIYQ